MISSADALYDWLTKGSSAGFQADLGLGPFRASGNAGFGASFSGPEEEAVLGGNFDFSKCRQRETGRISDFWYEPITGQNLPETLPGLETSATENQTPVEVLEEEAEPSVVQLQVRASPLTDSFTD